MVGKRVADKKYGKNVTMENKNSRQKPLSRMATQSAQQIEYKLQN